MVNLTKAEEILELKAALDFVLRGIEQMPIDPDEVFGKKNWKDLQKLCR